MKTLNLANTWPFWTTCLFEPRYISLESIQRVNSFLCEFLKRSNLHELTLIWSVLFFNTSAFQNYWPSVRWGVHCVLVTLVGIFIIMLWKFENRRLPEKSSQSDHFCWCACKRSSNLLSGGQWGNHPRAPAFQGGFHSAHERFWYLKTMYNLIFVFWTMTICSKVVREIRRARWSYYWKLCPN